MFQLAFGLGSDSDNCRWYNDIPRSLLSALDNAVYTVVKYIYAIFFNIADSQIINSQTISDFYSRVQLILGVIMIFDARYLTKRFFGFGDQNDATLGFKILGFVIAIVGALIIFFVK